LEALGLRSQLSFTILPAAFAHLLGVGGTKQIVVEKLASVVAEDPDSVMLACFTIRSLLLKTPLPDDLAEALGKAYARLSTLAELAEAMVTVRPAGASSHEGGRHRGLAAIAKAVATAYAEHVTRCVMQERVTSLVEIVASTPHLIVGQAMGWNCSGMLTNFEPRSGSHNFVVIYASWGLAEDIARKELGRDEFVVHKPGLALGCRSLVRRRLGHKEFRLDFDFDDGRLRHTEVPHQRVREFTLTPEEALGLARAALLMEGPVEFDWGMEEGWSRQIHLLGVRRATPPAAPTARLYRIEAHGSTIVRGKAVGIGLAVGQVRVIESREQLSELVPGEILVTRKTEPDWEPAFRQAGAIVTELDTRVSHATILARELGIPAVLEAGGCMSCLRTGQLVTVSCCQGETAEVYEGAADYRVAEFDSQRRPDLRTSLCVSLSMPERALAEATRPWAGAGLVRSEFMLSGWVRIHPMALCFPERLPDEAQGTVHRLTRGYTCKREYFVDQMSQGVATIASAFWPRPVLLRLSDLKSHEYARLVGGEPFEPVEANPVLGFRGACRYAHPDYRPAFELELAAARRVRDEMGLGNLHLMVPFCRTPAEAEEVLEIMGQCGLVRGHNGLEIWVMAELPSNVILADQFAELFDGMSIGSNDLTQLALGVDRENTRVGSRFDELHPALMACYERLIQAAHKAGKKVSFCGQAASDGTLLCTTLAEMGIDSISVAPDAFDRAFNALA
jgi:pyruvate,water dikinase